MQQYAMIYGTYMGIFWVLKFIFFPLGLTHPFLFLLFIGLTCCVPFLGYYYTKLYRDTACGGNIVFFKAWWFNTLVYLFASLLTGVGHYIYFQFIDHGYIIDTYETILKNFPVENAPSVAPYMQQMENALTVLRGLTPIEISMQLMSQNIIYGSFLALPTALFVMKSKK